MTAPRQNPGTSEASEPLSTALRYVLKWVRNIQNDDKLAGHYITDGVSGFFTNEFVMEPRTYGLTLNTRF